MQQHADTAMQRMRILIVEDDPLQAQLLATILTSSGFQTGTATTGLDALKQAYLECYDVMILDQRLPDIDGLEVARSISRLVGNQRRPILISRSAFPGLPGEGGPHDAFDAIISKTPHIDALLSAIVRTTHGKRSRSPRRPSHATAPGLAADLASP